MNSNTVILLRLDIGINSSHSTSDSTASPLGHQMKDIRIGVSDLDRKFTRNFWTSFKKLNLPWF